MNDLLEHLSVNSKQVLRSASVEAGDICNELIEVGKTIGHRLVSTAAVVGGVLALPFAVPAAIVMYVLFPSFRRMVKASNVQRREKNG